MLIEDMSIMDFDERMTVLRGKSFYNLPIEVRVQVDELHREQVTAEMLTEIHLMLRTIMETKGWKFNTPTT